MSFESIFSVLLASLKPIFSHTPPPSPNPTLFLIELRKINFFHNISFFADITLLIIYSNIFLNILM